MNKKEITERVELLNVVIENIQKNLFVDPQEAYLWTLQLEYVQDDILLYLEE